MEPEDFLDPAKTVWKYDQVITEEDLRNFVDTLVYEADSLPDGHIAEKETILIMAKTISALHDWLATGKHTDYKGLI